MMASREWMRAARRMAGVVSLAWSCAMHAAPNDYIRVPTVEYGEREIDFKSGTHRLREGGRTTAHALGYGLTPTAWWFTEVYAKWLHTPDAPQQFDAWEWENRLQWTQPGQYFVDVGGLIEIERPRNRAEGYELTMGPMFQAQWQLWQGNFNIFWQRHVRAQEKFATELLYQMQLKYRYAQQLEWGLQGFGNLGCWQYGVPAAEQSCQVGPALFGKVRVGTHQAIKWNAAILAGTTHATPRATVRVQAEYEF